MHHHAKGLSNDEINALALYFSQQKRITSTPLKPQALEVNHE
jgi:cytochrome c553